MTHKEKGINKKVVSSYVGNRINIYMKPVLFKKVKRAQLKILQKENRLVSFSKFVREALGEHVKRYL